MIAALSQVNRLAVLAASLAHFALGGLWFMALIGRRYAAVLGLGDRPTERPAPRFVLGPLLCGVVTVATSAVLLKALGIACLAEAAGFGARVGLGYRGAMTVNIAINPLFPRPFAYAWLNAPYFLAGNAIACLIFTAMP